MRSMFRSALLTLMAVLALGAMAATSASASEWLINLKPVTESTPVTFSLKPGKKFELQDKSIAGGEVLLTCAAVTGKGTVAPAGAGTITEMKLSKCTKIQKGACLEETKKSEEEKEWVRSTNLPWKTQFEGNFLAPVDNLSAGSPGVSWEFECKGIVGTIKDRCMKPIWETRLIGKPSEGVEQQFVPWPQGQTHAMECETGTGPVRTGAGNMTALVIVNGPEGKMLSYE